VDAARSFLRTHARVLERRLAEVHLDHDRAAATAVLDALGAYRNADGGFGHGLEADASAPASQPLGVDFATEVLDDLVTVVPEARPRARDLAAAAIPFLRSVTSPEGAVPIVLPTVAHHPRADHWGDGVFPAAMNPTAGLAGRFRFLGVDDPWVEAATAYCWQQLERPDGVGDAHTALGVLRFLETVPDRERAALAYDELGARFDTLRLFQPRPAAGYGLTPLHVAPHPDSPRRRFFSDAALDAHLDALAAGQQADGGWPLSWDPPGPVATFEWRGVETLRALRVLSAYGRCTV
jgi:hypothetical protein